jgi:hypothetical protein
MFIVTNMLIEVEPKDLGSRPNLGIGSWNNIETIGARVTILIADINFAKQIDNGTQFFLRNGDGVVATVFDWNKWEDYVKDTTRLGPTEYKFGDYDAGPVPIPGRG